MTPKQIELAARAFSERGGMRTDLPYSIWLARQNRHGECTAPRAAASYVMRHRYAWPGGYELAIVTTDGALICQSCARDNARQILTSTRDDDRDGWTAASITHAGEMEPENYCDQCGRDIAGE